LALTFTSLNDPSTWTTGAEGRNALGMPVDPTSDEAVRRCAEGWMRYHASTHSYSKQTLTSARRIVRMYLPGVTEHQRARSTSRALRFFALLPNIPDVNDRLGRRTIRSAFEQAMRALRTQGSAAAIAT
ncbi:MAG: hypothetical protein KBE09_04645, partial [Candidatus Pacebacteria bacterium]|nr:hypothetical protein [Candidatus Paceibacterota bacterium]